MQNFKFKLKRLFAKAISEKPCKVVIYSVFLTQIPHLNPILILSQNVILTAMIGLGIR